VFSSEVRKQGLEERRWGKGDVLAHAHNWKKKEVNSLYMCLKQICIYSIKIYLRTIHVTVKVEQQSSSGVALISSRFQVFKARNNLNK